MSTVKKFEKQPVIPDPPNTRTDTKAAFLQKADAFNPALKAWADSFNDTVIDNLNALVDVLNQQLPYINTVSDADAAIRTNANNIASINTLATHMTALLAVNLRLTEVKSVADNMAGVLAAQGYAEEAHHWAVVAETVGNVGIATAEKAGLVKPGAGLEIDTLGTLTVALSSEQLPAHAARHGAGGDDRITSLGPVTERAQALGTISGTVTIDLSAGLSVSATIGGATTLAFTSVPSGGAAVVVLRITNGGSAAVTWPMTITWAGSKAPMLTAAGKDMVVLATDDGGATWWGSAGLKYGAGV